MSRMSRYNRSMSKPLLPILLIVALSILVTSEPVHAQDQAALISRVLAAVNASRVSVGLPPYALNPLLTLSAQAHSEYQRSIGQFTHDGPGGTRPLDRALAVGYPATRVNENVYVGAGGPEEAVNWWLTADELHRNNVLHPVLREIGIGAATDANGMTYYTMDISAQPNVLPIFINSDSYSTNNPSVTLTLWNEEVFGSAPGRIGRATQIMVSNSPDFAGASPQSWAQYVSWTLDTSGGEGTKTVYVRFIDAYGRTADSQDSILLSASGENAPPTVLPPSPAAQPTIAVQPTINPSSAATPPVISSPLPSPQVITPIPSPTITPGATFAPYPTWTPEIAFAPLGGAQPGLASDAGGGKTLDSAEEATFIGLRMTQWRAILIGTLLAGLIAIAGGVIGLLLSPNHRTKLRE
jgi:uncharacterized protein YkwD